MSAIEAAIVERLHQLDERRKAQVLDFVEFLVAKYARVSPAADSPQIETSAGHQCADLPAKWTAPPA